MASLLYIAIPALSLLTQVLCHPSSTPLSPRDVSIPSPPSDPKFDIGAGAYAIEKPTAKDRDTWNKWWKYAGYADSIGQNNAARHLYHFLNNTGKDLQVSPDNMMYDNQYAPWHLLGFSGVREVARDLVSEEAKSAYKQAATGTGSAVSFRSGWKDYSSNGGSETLDWFLALGGFSYGAAGVVTAKVQPNGQYDATLEYVVYVVDRYNWDTGKRMGPFMDEELQRLHHVGIAREYNVRGKSRVRTVNHYSPNVEVPLPDVQSYKECVWEVCPFVGMAAPRAEENSMKKPWVLRIRNENSMLAYNENPALLDNLAPTRLLLRASDRQKTVNTKCVDVVDTASQQSKNPAPLGGLQNALPKGFSTYFGYDIGEDLNVKAKDNCVLSLFESKGCIHKSGKPWERSGPQADNLPYTVFSFRVSNCSLLYNNI